MSNEQPEPPVLTAHLTLPPPSPTEAAEGPQAVQEAAAIAAHADLSSKQELVEINKLLRGDRVETHVHRIFVLGAWVVAVGVVLCFAVVVAHMVLPTYLRFLDAEQINQLYRFLFTGVVGGLITKGGERLFSHEIRYVKYIIAALSILSSIRRVQTATAGY